MLLNEFLKEHRKNEEQEKTISELKSGMTALIGTVKEQAAQIQKGQRADRKRQPKQHQADRHRPPQHDDSRQPAVSLTSITLATYEVKIHHAADPLRFGIGRFIRADGKIARRHCTLQRPAEIR